MWSVLTEVIHERDGVAQWVVRLTRNVAVVRFELNQRPPLFP